MRRRTAFSPLGILLLSLMISANAASVLIVDPTPVDMPKALFDVEVKAVNDGTWRPLFVYHCTSMSEHPHAFGGAEGFVTFEHEGAVDVRITIPQPVRDVKVRPSLREPVAAQFTNYTATVRLERPRYLTVEINHGPLAKWRIPRYTLYLLADSVEKNRPDITRAKRLSAGHHAVADFDPGKKHTVYLEPGIHTVEGNVAPLHSGKTLYLAGGAVLRARVRADNVRDAKLLGRGILDGSPFPRDPGDWRGEGEQGFVFLRRGEHITIDGPIIYNSPYWNIVAFGTTHLTIRNHKAITWKLNNDGIQPRSCSDLLVENCFLKCADDCIAVKTRRAAAMESRRLVFRNLVLWNDIPGNPMEIGHTSQADLLEDVTFRDIEVIHGESERAHTISMCIIDHSTVRNVRYENIYVEGIKVKDIGLRVKTSEYTTDAERGRIRDVTIRNYFTDDAPQGGEITGFDAERNVEDVIIENFVSFANHPTRRRVMRDVAELKLKIQHAQNIKIRGNNHADNHK